MNKSRRTRIEKIVEKLETLRDEIEEIKSEEEDAYENLPENLQYSERGIDMESAIDCLEESYDSLYDAIDSLNELTES